MNIIKKWTNQSSKTESKGDGGVMGGWGEKKSGMRSAECGVKKGNKGGDKETGNQETRRWGDEEKVPIVL